MIAALHQSVTAATRRLMLAVGRGRIQQSNDAGAIQTVQVLLNAKELPDLRRLGNYGHASWPPDGCDAVAVFIGGDRSNGAVIATHDLKSRFKLGAKGESALFDNSGPGGTPGRWIWLKLTDGGSIEIEAKGTPVVINHAPAVTVNPPAGGACNVTLNLGGGNLVVNDAASVVLGPGNKKVVVDGDPVTGGVVHASQNVVKA